MESGEMAMREGWRQLRSLYGAMIREFDGFYILFSPPSPDWGLVPGSDDGGPETALCKDGQFHILNGDFRDKYDELGPKGFAACFAWWSSSRLM